MGLPTALASNHKIVVLPMAYGKSGIFLVAIRMHKVFSTIKPRYSTGYKLLTAKNRIDRPYGQLSPFKGKGEG